MPMDAVLGLQRGDEGKGRVVDSLAKKYEVIARFNGGNNAGHTVVLPDERELKLNLIPSGIAHPGTANIIGNGTLVDPIHLLDEMDRVKELDIEITPERLLLSSAAHLITPAHIERDRQRENGHGRQGSTVRGIAYAASDKYLREGVQSELLVSDPDQVTRFVYEALRANRPWLGQFSRKNKRQDEQIAHDYVSEAITLQPFITDTVIYLNDRLGTEPSAHVLAEGAQSFWLDVDQGMYPCTTSSHAAAGGILTGLGIGPRQRFERIVGVAKAIQSHVGGGPFVTEIHDPKLLSQLHGNKTSVDAECGTTTGRTRRLGYFDLPMIRRANIVNTITELALTKLDWLPRFGGTVQICTAYRYKGARIKVAPASTAELEKCKPEYTDLKLWNSDISGIQDFDSLPRRARDFVRIIEEYLQLPITMIGVGPRRDQVIVRE